ncbi:MAG: hypothetical protein PHD97_03565 [Bacteroidales bacterium]|nr:hypothetical protein [Bacteroidales bacterium]
MQSGNDKKNWRNFIIVFFIANLFLSSYFIDIWPTPNPVSRALPVFTFAESRTLIIDKYAEQTIDKSKVGNHFYSDKAPLPTFLAIPFYELIKTLGLTKVSNDAGKKFPVYVWRPMGMYDSRQLMFPEIIPLLILGGFLFGSLPFVLIVMLTFSALRKLKLSFSPVLLVMLSFYGSFLFVFSGTYFNHVFAALLLLLSYIELKNRKFFLSGIWLGLAFLSEYPVIIAAPVWFILILIKERKIKFPVFFAAGVLPSGILICVYNFFVSGNAFKMLNAYHAHEAYKELSNNYGFSFPSFESLWGLSFSSTMGIFVFAPVLFIIGYYLIYTFIKDKTFKEKIKTSYIAIFSILFFLVIASFFTWWGGWSYGPRYLAVLAAILIYEGLIFISKYKINTIVFGCFTFFGILSAWFAKSTLVYMIPDEYMYNNRVSSVFSSVLSPEFNAKRFNANNFLTAVTNAKPESGVYLWLFLFIAATLIFYFWYKKITPIEKNIVPENKKKENHHLNKRKKIK